MENKEIILGQGVGDIKLGMTQEQIEAVIGQPDNVDEMEYDDGGSAVTWMYFDLQLELNFESEDDFKLSFISIENSELVLKGKIKIGMSKAEVIEACKELGIKEPIVESFDQEDAPDQELLALETENVNLWFTNDKLDEMQMGPFWEDDETPIWPEL